MAERPPTSRQRVASASQRPKTASRGPARAPPSTATPVMRSSSRLGSALRNRADIRDGARVTTAVVPEGTIRPTTQQGFGARPASRLRTGVGGRQVADKTYYLGLLNTQLHSLDNEITSLEKELSKIEAEQKNLLIYEQKAEEQASEIKALQGQLADYNLLIDRQNSSADLSELEAEIQHYTQQNDELGRLVEDLFQERQLKEEQCKELEMQIDEVKQQNRDLIDEMGVSRREEFDRVKEEMNLYRRMVEESQQELQDLTAQKDKLDLALARHPLKQEAMNLQEQISGLTQKKQQIQQEMSSDASPEEQKNALIEQIKRDNEEIEKMQEQIKDIEGQVQMSQEELHEFENEFEMMAGEKNERYRELKHKERQLDEFLSSFDAHRVELSSQLSQKQLKVISLLRAISANCQRDELIGNVTGLDESAINYTMNSSADPNELKDLHVRLQEELISLDETEAHHRAEMESIRNQQKELESTKARWENLADRKSKMEQDIRMLQEQHETLSKEVNSLKQNVARLRENVAAIEENMRSNPYYPELRELKRRFDSALDERYRIRTELEAKQAEFNYSTIKDESLSLCSQYNQYLIEGPTRLLSQ